MAAKKKKVLVGIGTLAHMGGAERQALYLVEHLTGLQHCDVEVLTFEHGRTVRAPLETLGVRVHVVPYYFRWPKAKRTKALAELALVVRMRARADALVPFGAGTSKAMALVWRPSGATFCWWNQQDEGRELSGTAVERRILEEASCITSNSTAGRDFLSQTYGLALERILVYNNGTPIPDPLALKPRWRSELNIGNRKVVTMVANVTGFKDHTTLLAAWPKVLANFPGGPKPILLLAGSLQDQKTVDALKVQAFDLSLSPADVQFLGPVSDVSALLAESDLVVHSSITEGCPNAVCEAMALSRAVVATDIPGCRQALGENGVKWLAPPRDWAALGNSIISLLQNDSLRQEVGRENLARIKESFTIDGMNQFFQSQIERGLQSPLS